MVQDQGWRDDRSDTATGRTYRRARPKAAAVTAAGVVLLALTACGDRHVVPEEHYTWELIDTIELEAVDSSSDVYIEGSFRTFLGTGDGEMESHQVIDYQYAEVIDEDGGIQQKMLSDHFDSYPAASDTDLHDVETPVRTRVRDSGGKDLTYPGTDIVTIYQHEDETDPRIEAYYCLADEDHLEEAVEDAPFSSSIKSYGCEGTPGTEYPISIRYEIHVPEGSVVQTFDEQSEEVEQ